KRLESSPVASRSMITFLALNTSIVTLIQTKVIAFIMQYVSFSLTEIVGSFIVSTLIYNIFSISSYFLFILISYVCCILSYFTLISTWIISCFILIILVMAVKKKLPAYELFVEGGKEGIEMAFTLLPFLLGMIVAISILRSSGALEAFVGVISPILIKFGVPPEIIPLAFSRPISGTAALGIMSELTETYGPDSFIGRLAATMQGSTDTTLYILTV